MIARLTRRLPEIYLVVALFVATLLCVLTPPFDVPDEGRHARREVELARGEVMARVGTSAEGTGAWGTGAGGTGAGGTTDSNFEMVVEAMEQLRIGFNEHHASEPRLPDGRVTAEELAPWQGVHWSGRPVFGWFPNTAVYPPGLYLTQTIGWRIGEALDLTILHSLYLARMLTMLCAVGLGWLTLRLCRQGRWLLCAYLLLPTVLSLEASCSQDALLLPIMALMMVLLLRAIEEVRALRNWELVLLGILMALCIGARVPYLPLSLVLLLPAVELPKAGWRKLMPAAVVIVVVAGIVGAWQLAVRPLGVYGPPEANPALQVAFLKLHPVSGIESLVEALVREVPLTTLKGLSMLGSNDAGPSHALYGVMMLGLAGIVLLNPSAGLKTRMAKAVLAFSLLSVVAGLWLAEYVIWTQPGAMVVKGFNSRYFLALVPFTVLFGWRWVSELVRLPQKTSSRMLVVAASMYLFAVFSVPFVAARVFYLSQPATAVRFLLR